MADMRQKTLPRCGSHETLRIEAFLYVPEFAENARKPLSSIDFSLQTNENPGFSLEIQRKSTETHDFH